MKFFKQTTLGHVVLMGRKTFDSLGRPLPNRENLVLSRQPLDTAGVTRLASFDDVAEPADGRKLFVIGGAEIYKELLPRCDELLLTVVKLTPPADTFFPDFESMFDLAEVLDEDGDLEIRRYVRKRD